MILLELKADPKLLKRGHKYMWQQMMELSRGEQSFTTQQIFDLCKGVNRRTVKDFITRLEKASYIVAHDEKPSTYFVIKRQTNTPRARRDGTIAVNGQQRIWNAIRQLKTFKVQDLKLAASCPDYAPTTETIKSYVKHLVRAGYLTISHPDGKRKPWFYALKPRMNSGPTAPAILKSKMVYDANENKIMGEIIAESDND